MTELRDQGIKRYPPLQCTRTDLRSAWHASRADIHDGFCQEKAGRKELKTSSRPRCFTPQQKMLRLRTEGTNICEYDDRIIRLYLV